MGLQIYQVDAFATEIFNGNPAGIVLDAGGLSEDQMQKISREMQLSETAFIIPEDEGDYKVRFFTPTDEVDLCGHATIASFYTLAYEGKIPAIDQGIKKVFQKTKAGRLAVEIHFSQGEVDKVLMEMAKPEALDKIMELKPLLDCFNIEKEDLGIDGSFVRPEIISTGLPDILLPLNSKTRLDELKIDYNRLRDYSKEKGVTGVHAFHLPALNSDRVFARNFAPLVGIDEEAATGTANGALIYFLKKEGYINGNSLMVIQGETLNRPSRIYCEIFERAEGYVVKVGGPCRIVFKGDMYI